MTTQDLDCLFRPRSLAVFRGPGRAHDVGARLVRNLLKGGFRGPIYLIDPKGDAVEGAHAYRDAASLPDIPDLALLCQPIESVPETVDSIGARGVRAVAVYTSAARAADGVRELRAALVAAAKRHSMRILGPNSMGLIVPALGLNASFAPAPVEPGAIALVSQSGGVAAAALDWAASRDIGFSCVVSPGDAVDVDAADVLDFLGSDPSTRFILLYLESVKEGRALLSAARAASRAKPIIVLKSGRTAEGAAAVMRRTGRESGDDSVFSAAVRRAGMLRVNTIGELFAAAETLARSGSRQGDRLLILGNAGGPGIIAVDTLTRKGGEMGTLDTETVTGLRSRLPDGASPANPIDLGPEADAGCYAGALQTLLEAPGRDAILVIHGPGSGDDAREIAEACAATVSGSTRNVLACWMGGERAVRSANALREAGVAVHGTPETAVEAFLHAVEYRRNQEALQETPSSMLADLEPDEETVRGILRRALDEGQERLTEPEGKSVLAAYGIPIVPSYVAATADDAAALAKQIGYPVALKVVSPDLDHRSDVGGVMLNLVYENEVRRAVEAIAGRMRDMRPDARLAGYTVQRMVRRPGALHVRHDAHELALRVALDPAFGLVANLGRSGADARIERAVGLLPLNAALAHEALLRAGIPSALAATPGRPAADLAAICLALARVSQLLVDHAEILQLEIDPLLADEKGVMALDVRMAIGRPSLAPARRFAIRPYPKELEQAILLGGDRYLLRPIRPEDSGAYSDFIVRTDAPDLRMRHFRLVRSLPARDLARYTQIDYDREMAFVAVKQDEPEAGAIVGEVRAFTYPDEGNTAELAVLVRSDAQRRGLGRALLSKMIGYCEESGVGVLIAQILVENQRAIELVRGCGMQVEITPGATIAVAHLEFRAGKGGPLGGAPERGGRWDPAKHVESGG
jgi:acetyltransferase